MLAPASNEKIEQGLLPWQSTAIASAITTTAATTALSRIRTVSLVVAARMLADRQKQSHIGIHPGKPQL
jgi:hypothetical protein